MLKPNKLPQRVGVLLFSAMVLALAGNAGAVLIAPTTATESSFFEFSPDQATGVKTINGDGLTAGLHNTTWSDMWISDGANDPNPWIKYGLVPELHGEASTIDNGVALPQVYGMKFWNCNQVSGTTLDLTDRGIKTVKIWGSTTGVGIPDTDPGHWFLIANDIELTQAPGHASYAGESYYLASQGPVEVSHIVFEDIVTFDPQDPLVGISEVRFAVVPEPGTLAVLALSGLVAVVRRKHWEKSLLSDRASCRRRRTKQQLSVTVGGPARIACW